jgi:type IV secretory pathway TrbF-like protein
VLVAKKMKVFLPRWVLWILVPVLALIWGIITYAAFVLVGVMLWLMASGRLPAYVIEVDDADDSTKP